MPFSESRVTLIKAEVTPTAVGYHEIVQGYPCSSKNALGDNTKMTAVQLPRQWHGNNDMSDMCKLPFAYHLAGLFLTRCLATFTPATSVVSQLHALTGIPPLLDLCSFQRPFDNVPQ